MQLNVLLNRIETLQNNHNRTATPSPLQDYQQERPPAEHGEQFPPLRLSAKNFYVKGVAFN